MTDLSWPLQRKLLRAPEIGFNAELKRHFADVDADESLLGRKALRDSLLILAKDSRTTALFKLNYFRDFVQKVHLRPAIVGLDKQIFDLQYDVAYRPHVSLCFQQDADAVPDGYHPVNAYMSFRLMNETTTTITQANLETLANQIKAELATGPGYTFDKGKHLCKYIDKENGYDFQIYALSDAEGEQVARKIIGIRNHPFSEDNFKITTPRRNSENVAGNITILGKSTKKPRWRPTAKVRFLYADILIHGRPEPICLIDRTGKKLNPVVKAY